MLTRLYFKQLREWYVFEGEYGFTPRLVQFEVQYKDYDETGKLVSVGTEDFSIDRWNKQTSYGFVYGWNGIRRNAGGRKWWEVISAVRYRKGDRKHVLALYKQWRGADYAEVIFRNA